MLVAESITGSSDNDVLYTSQEVDRFNEHYIQTTAGAVTVQGTWDGTNWTGDLTTTTMATGVAKLEGVFKKIRVLQDGATGSSAVVAHANKTEP